MVVFFDIDGTIVDDKTQIIPESTVRAVERLGENGHLAVVNTGRPFSHLDPRIRRMDFGAWICGCGMEIRLYDGWLVRRAPDTQVCAKIRDAVRACGMRVLYEGQDGDLFTDGAFSRHEALDLEAERMRRKGFLGVVLILTMRKRLSPQFAAKRSSSGSVWAGRMSESVPCGERRRAANRSMSR